jgi:uncharacterized protein YycO
MSVQPCDLLFYKGKGMLSRIVESVTDSPYSHVALILDSLHVVETDFFRPVNIYHISYPKGSYDIYRAEGLSSQQAQRIIEYTMTVLGQDYDLIQSLSHLTNRCFGFPLVNFQHLKNCSELVDLAFKHAGFPLLDNDFNGTVTPGQLSLSRRIKRVTVDA